MDTFKIHKGHILMTVGTMIGIASVGMFMGHADAADGVRIIMSSIGTVVLLLTFKDLFKV